MATFESTQNMIVQQHFEVLEIDLPVITGTCTLNGAASTGTPLTCDEAWTNEYKTYYFTNENAPVLPSINGEPIYRCIKSIAENSTELKVGDGLASRSSLTVVVNDFTGQDPNSYAAGVTETVKNQGTYFGKLSARQIFENKDARLKLYRVEADGSIDLVNGAQTRNFLTSSISLNSNGSWNIACKDLLSLVNLNEKSFHVEQGGTLRLDIDDFVMAIPVDALTDYSSAEVIRIGDDFMRVLSVDDNLTSTATLNVQARASDVVGLVSGVLLTETNAESHKAGDEVFICYVSDDQPLDEFLEDVLTISGFPSSLIPSADWASEVAEWHANGNMNTLHSESESVNDVINRALEGFLMDLWFSAIDNEAKLSAISVWKESTATLTEGREINSRTIKKTAIESLRASRALIQYDKPNLSDVEGFKKASRFSDPNIIGEQFYREHKDKQFDANWLLNDESADLLVQRYVSRFKFTPYERNFVTDERYLTFKTGDVVDLSTTVDQSIFGLPSGNIRAQITKINPTYKNGRQYNVKALTYEAAFSSGSEIVIDTPLGAVNLFILAGAPSQDVELTFILAATHSYGDVAIAAGNFSPGSKITLILVNGFAGQANGGDGGYYAEFSQNTNGGDGGDGGTVYNANGVDTDIYFSGATPSAAYPVADGYILAPGGGGGGSGYVADPLDGKNSAGGGGGAGILVGEGFQALSSNYASGANGSSLGTGGAGGVFDETSKAGDGGGWGVAGQAGDDATTLGGAGGAAGSGVIDSGATVTFFGSSASRYINGNGDH